MYLSKLVLNERCKMIYGDLGNAHRLHQRIMQGFPDESVGNPRQQWHILYRQEPDSLMILIQSVIEPNWSRLPQDYLLSSEIKQINWEEKQFSVGNLYQFRLKANPSKRDKETGKTIGMFHREDQINWLNRKSAQAGFQTTGVDVISAPKIYGTKAGTKPIQIYSVLFQGILQVTDSSSFFQCLKEGIGRGRSYGCGLLSLAKFNFN